MAVQAVPSQPVSFDTTEKSIRTMPDYTGLCRMRSIKRFVFRVSQPVPGGLSVEAPCESRRIRRIARACSSIRAGPCAGYPGTVAIPCRSRRASRAGRRLPRACRADIQGDDLLRAPVVFPGRVEPDHTLRARSPGRDRVVPMIRRRRKGRRYMRLHRGNAQGQCTGGNARGTMHGPVYRTCRAAAGGLRRVKLSMMRVVWRAGKSWAVAHSSLRQAHPGG